MKLSWLENAYSRSVLLTGDLDQDIGQGDLVSDVRLGFSRGSVCARLEVSVYSGLGLVPPWLFQNLIRTF